MEDLNQLDGVADHSVMEEDSTDAPLSPHSPNNAGSRNPAPLHSPLLIHRMVSETTTNDERPGNDTVGVQGNKAVAEVLILLDFITGKSS